MSMEWNEIFKLPVAALAGDKRIPKSVVVRQAELTKREQKTLNKVKRLSHFATVQKSTTYILPHVDDGHDVESIVFLLCEMSEKSAALSEVAGLLHRCFPNPTILLMEGSGTICVSAALTRKSLSEKGAIVIEEQRSTGALDPDDSQLRVMLKGLAFERLPQENLLIYLREMMWRIRLIKASETLGFYPECDSRDKERLLKLLAEAEHLGKEATELAHTRRDRELSLNEQMGLRVKLKNIEKKRDQMVAGIKELCSERD